MDDRLGATDLALRASRVAAPLRQNAVERVREAIAIGRFMPGQRLLERELCAMLDVSRTIVREALRQLESEGMIRVVANKGPVVSELTAEEARGVYQVRAELEGLASQLFAERASPQQRQQIRRAFARLKKDMRSGDRITRLKAKNAFYECLVAGSGNKALGTTLHLLNSQIMLLRATSLRQPGRLEGSLEEVAALVEALVAGDAPLARRLSEIHVRNAADAALGILDPGEAG